MASNAIAMPRRGQVMRLDEAESVGLFYPSTPGWAATPTSTAANSLTSSWASPPRPGRRDTDVESVSEEEKYNRTQALRRASVGTPQVSQLRLRNTPRDRLQNTPGHQVGSYTSNTGRYGRATLASMGKTYGYLRQMQTRAFADEFENTPREHEMQPPYTPMSDDSGRVPSRFNGVPSHSIDTPDEGEMSSLLSPSTGRKPSPRRRRGCPNWMGITFLKAVLFGIINGVVILPVMVGFAHIIFRDPFFTPYISSLTKLVLFSAAVHQFGFTCTSSLPFAIGQVQDAGLIFLSSMATSIVAICKSRQASDEETLATVLCWLAISTSSLGVALIITGKLRLAALVQYLPLPVIGGYLAFIGFYCFEAGLSLMTGKQINGIHTWGEVMNHNSAILMAPGLALGISLLFFVQRVQHPAALPCALIAIPALFYVVLIAGGYSLAEARGAYGEGWLDKESKQASFWQAWDGYRFGLVQWYAIPSQLPTWIAMYFVVAFSSSLDVAAIQMELGRNLDFNHELKTVGLCNLISGLTGGFTGSYIFSQTIFTMRSGTQSRVTGFTLVLFGLMSFMLPISLLEYIPKFFFGAVLTFIAVDLIIEYLVHSHRIVVFSEYAIIWGTFIAIVVTNNLEIGFGIGVALCVLHFMFLYATSNAVKRLAAASTVIRGFRQRRTLAHHRTTIAAHGLQGYIFFGSALAILREVKRSIYIEDAAEDDGGVVVTPTSPSRKNFVRLPKRLVSLENDRNSLNEHVVQRHTTMLPTRFVLLDFDNVSGVDATAVRSLFVSLAQTVSMHGITLVITAVPDGTFKLLKANGVIENFVDNFKAFKTLDLGLQYCEDALLEQIDPHLHPTRLTTADEDIHGILKAYIFESMSFPNPGKALGDNRALLLEYFDLLRVKEGSPLWLEGSASDTIYFVRTGSFLLYRDRAPAILTKRKRWLSWMSGHRDLPARTRMAQYGQGGLIGELDFFAHQPRSFSAVPLEDSEVYALTRTKLTTMYLEHSDLAALLQHVILKSLSLSAAQTRTQVHES
eukprot:m.169060 g.169060  ORF g.169060 m.169060 type:complete len:1024 (-) comp24150_c0_seq1:110-3181(-)